MDCLEAQGGDFGATGNASGVRFEAVAVIANGKNTLAIWRKGGAVLSSGGQQTQAPSSGLDGFL